MADEEAWYVVKLETEQCAVVTSKQLNEMSQPTPETKDAEKWGPFASQGEAIARRVGLIRSGKCQPV